jgi:hypothetical protein
VINFLNENKMFILSSSADAEGGDGGPEGKYIVNRRATNTLSSA